MEFEYISENKLTETILNGVDFTVGGKLANSNLETHLTSDELSNISPWKFAHWIAIANWLTDYNPDVNATNLEKVRGYVEAFHHLCELSEWKKALIILFVDTRSRGGSKVLHEQLFIWGNFQEQVDLYKRVLNKFSLDIDCLLMYGLGRAYGYLGQIEMAISTYNQLLTVATEINNYSAEAQAHAGLGRIYEWQINDCQKALFHYRKQLNIAVKINDSEQELIALFGIAASYLGFEQYHQSIKFAQKALSLAITSLNVEMEINILGFIGVVYSQLGWGRKGLVWIERQLELSLKTGNVYQESLAYSRLGVSYLHIQEYDKAIEYFQRALTIVDTLGDQISKARFLANLGAIYSCVGEHLLATKLLNSALNIEILIGCRYRECWVMSNLAYNYLYTNHSESYTNIQLAINIANELKSQELLGICLGILAHYYWLRGNYMYGAMFIIKSFWIYPPWKSANTKNSFRIAMQLLKEFIVQIIHKYKIYFRVIWR